MPTITASDLTKRFGAVTAVSGLSFELGAGVTGFLGPNGAGKTTTLRMLLGLVRPTSGAALIDGVPYAELEQPLLRVGAVLEASNAHPGRRARDHLRVLASAAGVAASRAEEVLAEVGLADAGRRRVGGFSLGMRQRLGLAAALLGDPDVLVLDEPANGLDPEGVHWLREFLREYAARGRTVLVSSHLLAEVAQSVDQVLIIARGHLVRQATLAELRAEARSRVHVRTTEPDRLVAVLSGAGLTIERDGNGSVDVDGATTDRVGMAAAEHGIPILEMTARSPSLEEIYLELTGEDPS